MRLANLQGRATLMFETGIVDVEEASAGEFSPDVQALFPVWDAFSAWAASDAAAVATVPAPGPLGAALEAVVPRPGQVFAVGLNYREHAIEAGLPIPEVPLVFTKFPSSVAAPHGVLELPTDQVDWEVEVAVVIGRTARRISQAEAWRHVAGVTGSQDFSARDVQLLGGAKPQFSLGKSFEGFTPLGPVLTTVDEFDNPDDIVLETRLNGESVQKSSTADLVFTVPQIVSYLSHIVTLRPGDVILTGTPSGVGLGLQPPRYLVDGDEVTTYVEGVGEMQHLCRAPEVPFDPIALLA
ncbi:MULTISPECIES: fumarylacetoacetate hydrolase family protein [unclassified Nocardioides]|uniref:fumarylacetoacetate hydrolase family protein n=1 Tax=unclassified Nocardioides TaxID=2615069 RepID=UPI0006F349E5|nr:MULTISPECIES: fumarylacetoacetate hydrolase family protein [unclassified Nocardioides]KRA37680.1 fumarylacetoacetate hydrolase [Nocardioides sp. Root614]KRA91640.1 fumarylacetoacetate hydrolase [Nocardioides sp. Root682]